MYSRLGYTICKKGAQTLRRVVEVLRFCVGVLIHILANITMQGSVTKKFYNSPSAFINAFFTSSNITVAKVGGTALPICFFTSTDPNLCPSGNFCRQANSRLVKDLVPLGW